MNLKLITFRKLSETFDCPMNFRRFPFDSQMCPIMFESFKYTVDTLYFNWLDSPVDIDPVWWAVIMDSEHFGKKTSYGQFPITVPVCKWFGYIYMCNLTTWDLILDNFLYIKILLISRAPDSYPDLKNHGSATVWKPNQL